MGYIAENARRFFHPAAINEMLSTFVPLIDGTKLDVSNCTLALDRILSDVGLRAFYPHNIIS